MPTRAERRAPKVHLAKKLGGVECGTSKSGALKTSDLDKVTCKLCIRKRTRGRTDWNTDPYIQFGRT